MSKSEGQFSRWRDGFRGFTRGFSFINEHKLWKYLYFPSILSVLLGVGLFIAIYLPLLNWLLAYVEMAPTWLQWILSLFTYIKITKI